MAKQSGLSGAPNSLTDLRRAIQGLITASDKATLHHVLANYPGLLQPSFDSFLTRLLQEAWGRGENAGVCIFLACRAFLTHCRSQGVEAVLARPLALPLPRGSPLGQLLLSADGRVDLTRRAELARRALADVRRASEPDLWATLQRELADCLARSEGRDRAERLEEALDSYRATLRVWDNPPYAGSSKWAQTLHAIAATLRRRVKGERADNLKQALQLYRQALTVRTKKDYPSEWAETQHDLGATWLEMPVGDRMENVQKGIECYEAALTVRTRQEMPDLWAETTHDLAIAYSEHPGGDRAQNLEKAIELCQTVLQVRSPDKNPLDWGRSQVALGNTYVMRLRGGRTENLEEAIHCYEKALKAFQDYPADWARTCYNLAVAYRHRPIGDKAGNLGEAIEHYRQALEVYTSGTYPIEWAHVQTGLGNTYCQPEVGQRARSLEEAIACYQAALTVRTRDNDPAGWATVQNNLGNAYADRISGERADNQEKAIACYQNALQVRTRKTAPARWAETMNNLGAVYSERLRGDLARNRKKAVHYLRQALKIHKPLAFPNDSRRAARNLGNLFFDEGRWTEAHAAYTTALQAAKALYTAAFMEAGREAEISENATLYAHDAFCLAHLGQLGEALVQLEEGKTRTLAERLGRDAVQLEKAKPEDRRAYRELLNHLKALEAEQRAGGDDRSPAGTGRPYTEIAGDVKQARKELDTLTQRIHNYLPDFLPAPLDFAAIQALVPDEQTALVELCVTEKGSVVLVVRREAEPQAVWVEGFTQGELQHLLLKRGERGDPTNGWLVTYWQYQQAVETYAHAKRKADQQSTSANLLALETARVACDQAWAAWHAATDWITAEIGRRLVAPLHTALHGFSTTRLVLIPQGSLFLVPLHATLIGKDGLRLLDRYEVSYTPSAAVLQRCQERAAQARGQGLLAVINPQKDPRLVFTFVEGERIASLFSKDQLVLLEEYEGTKKAVLQNVQGRGYLHFSCHGIYNWSDPLKSGLFLTDPDRLTLEDLQRPSLEFEGEGEKERVEVDMTAAHLVTLSACETGITEATTSRADEYVGLPAGFMLAGVPCVVSSLWSVQDLSTALLMERFYVNHLRGDPDENPRTRSPLPSAEALRRAQIWLRDEVTAQEAARRCDEQIKKLRDRRELVPKWLSEAWRKYSWMARKAPDGRPFAHPFYWAAFILSGTTSDPDRKER